MPADIVQKNPQRKWRELWVIFGCWIALAVITIGFARQNLSAPGLYYDEAIFAGMAKDFIIGHVHGQHLPDHETITLLGRPFPLFVQSYLGALKCWMLIPAFQVFGSTFAVLRASNVFWQLAALLLFMLGARRWFGLGIAIIAGVFLALDPNYFFVCTLDWGVAVPSFVCRCACFYFAIRWKDLHKLRDAFFVGLFAGLGFFNKADFVVFLSAITVAALICYWRQLFGTIRQHLGAIALACLGFAIGGGPMVVLIPRLVVLTIVGPHLNSAPQDFAEKFRTLISMYNGSYFYRLMNVGGIFERMHDGASPAHFLGIILLLGCLSFVGLALTRRIQPSRSTVFLIVAAVLVTLGVFAMPDAIRIHHSVLVYPLPHLILAVLMATFWKMRIAGKKIDYAIAAVITIVFVGLIAGELHTTFRTEQLIQQTGGRGRWSESLNEFCREVRDRKDLTVVSLDWGFNEQLIFLTDEPELSELIWQLGETPLSLPTDANYIYLVHPPEYSLVKHDSAYLDQLQKSGQNAEITPHYDRQHEIAFYTIQFRQP